MTVMSWLRLTISLWLIRKTAKAAGWLLLVLLALALWPLTVVTAAGYRAASMRGWPPARLYRAAAASLLVTAGWVAAAAVRPQVWRAAALVLPRTWAHSWHHLAALTIVRVFLLAAPAAIPAGLALAGGLWSWRNYAISAGIGGRMASAPVAPMMTMCRPHADAGTVSTGRHLQATARMVPPTGMRPPRAINADSSASGRSSSQLSGRAGTHRSRLDSVVLVLSRSSTRRTIATGNSSELK